MAVKKDADGARKKCEEQKEESEADEVRIYFILVVLMNGLI